MTVAVGGAPPVVAKEVPTQIVATYRDVRKKVDCIEAERIMYVFVELHRRLMLLGGFASLSQDQFKQFPESCKELRTAAAGTTNSEAELQVLTRNALRDVSQDPALCAQLRRAKPDARLEKMANLVEKLKAAMLERLTMTQNEEEDRIMYIRKANQKRKETLQQCEKLDKELLIAQEQRTAEANKRAETIRQLKQDLHQIEQFAEESARRVKSEIEKQQQSDIRNSEQKQAKLVNEIKPLKVDHAKLVAEHREVELNLRGKKFRMETEVDNWISKYDEFMGMQQENIEKVQGAYDEEKEQLDQLRERFEVLKVDYDQIMDERRLKREEEERKRKEFEEKTYNATVIQAFFRSYKVRKLMKNKGKKGKGKGKKGKGK